MPNLLLINEKRVTSYCIRQFSTHSEGEVLLSTKARKTYQNLEKNNWILEKKLEKQKKMVQSYNRILKLEDEKSCLELQKAAELREIIALMSETEQPQYQETRPVPSTSESRQWSQVWEKKLQESKAIEREVESPLNKSPVLQPVQQTTSIGTSATITHQLAMPGANIVPQTLLQYTNADAQKTMALNLPQKLTLTVPAHLAQSDDQSITSSRTDINFTSNKLASENLPYLKSAPSGTTALQFPADLASFFQGTNVITSGHPNSIQHGGQQITGVHYQTLTSEQLKNALQFTVTIPVSSAQSQGFSNSVPDQLLQASQNATMMQSGLNLAVGDNSNSNNNQD